METRRRHGASLHGSVRPGPTVVETHVSVLVFLDDVVLKYKKPVRFPFLDFGTAEARRAACEAEVEANRRLSPDVYLGVADVVLGDRTLDHAVVMRRLPADRSLAAQAQAHAPDLDVQLARLASVLADFHAKAARSPAIDAGGGADAVAETWRGCLDSLTAYAGPELAPTTVARVEDLALGFLAGRRALFDQRVTAGRVCDGHGDLLATDVFLLDDGPRVLDCVEFDPRLRHVDVIADVAFLAMDLERFGAPAAAATFLRLYEEMAGDLFPPSLVHHYCAQRALVRAEVACIRASQADGAASGAPALLDLALHHLEEGRVVLGVVCGAPGTGKSTVAAAVGERLGWPVLRSDEVRRELVDPGAATAPLAPFGGEGYSPETTERTYLTLLGRARAALGLGQSVVLDATFTDRRWHDAAERLADDTTSALVVVQCTAGLDVTVPRLRARRDSGADVSGADEEVGRALVARARPWPVAVPVDTAHVPVHDSIEAALAAFGRPAPAPPGSGVDGRRTPGAPEGARGPR